MSSTSAPFGMRPAFHPSGLDRATALAGGIASTYGSDILKGQPVTIVIFFNKLIRKLNNSRAVFAFLDVQFNVFFVFSCHVFLTRKLSSPKDRRSP